MPKVRKVVLIPFIVPTGKYCWNSDTGKICTHVDTEGGVPFCELKLGILSYENDGKVLKSKKCKGLREDCYLKETDL